MEEILNKTALKYLDTDPLWHTGLKEVLSRGIGKVLKANDNGVLILDNSEKIYMLSANDLDAAKELISDLKSVNLIVAYQDFLVDYLKERYSLKGCNKCVQAVYLSKEKLKVDDRFEFAPLTARYLDKIIECYHYESPKNLRRKLNRAEVIGAFLNKDWVGFVGMHDEGTMGMLEVFPAFRRIGAGTAISSYMINRNLDQGYIPFAHIISNNEASLALNRKLGMDISSKYLYWLY